MSFARRSTLLLSFVWLAACSGGESMAPKNEAALTRDELEQLVSYLMNSSSSQPSGSQNRASSFNALGSGVPVPYSFEDDIPCDAGGSMSLSGTGNMTVDEEAGTIFQEFSQVQSYNDCAFPMGEGESFKISSGAITTTGSSLMELVISTDSTPPDEMPALLALNINGVGSFVLEAHGKSLECEFALTGILEAGSGSTEPKINGKVCGYDVVDGVMQENNAASR